MGARCHCNLRYLYVADVEDGTAGRVRRIQAILFMLSIVAEVRLSAEINMSGVEHGSATVLVLHAARDSKTSVCRLRVVPTNVRGHVIGNNV